MDGKVKVRPTMTVPASLGRQIGILPVPNDGRRRRPRDPHPPQHATYEDVDSNKLSTGSKYRVPTKPVVRRNSDRNVPGRLPSTTDLDRNKPSSGRKKLESLSLGNFSSRSNRSYTGGRSSRSTRSNRDGLPSDSDRTEPDDSSEQDILFMDIAGGSSASSIHSEEPLLTERRAAKHITVENILQQNQERDVSKIYEVCLHAEEITHIVNLEKFTSLRVLDLSCNHIEKIENLDNNRDLREFKLYGNKLTVIENLKHLRELSNLQLQYNHIKHIGKGLSPLSKLKMLRIDCNRIMKMEASELSSCVQLTSINVSYNMLDSLSALNYLPNLEEIHAAGNRIRQLDLSRCKKLSEVDVSKNRISDLSTLKGLPNLQVLNIASNHVSSLKPLGKMKVLQEVYAAENRISELSFIPAYFPRLEILNVSGNKIHSMEEVSSLAKLEDIAELFIHGNPFCVLDGEPMPYMTDIQEAIPQLEILDGAHIKKHAQKGAPLMRPMTASTIISVRQVESQMKTAMDEMDSFEKGIRERFDSLRDICTSLSSTSIPPSKQRDGADDSGLPQSASSKTSGRARIQQALKFASENFEDLP